MNFSDRLNQNWDRPRPVTSAVVLLYTDLLLVVLVYLIQTVGFVLNAAEQAVSDALVIECLISPTTFAAMFIVARKIAQRKNWARWVLTLVFAFVLMAAPWDEAMTLRANDIGGYMMRLDVLLTLSAIVLLFRPASRAWFSAQDDRPEVVAKQPGPT